MSKRSMLVSFWDTQYDNQSEITEMLLQQQADFNSTGNCNNRYGILIMNGDEFEDFVIEQIRQEYDNFSHIRNARISILYLATGQLYTFGVPDTKLLDEFLEVTGTCML